MAQITMFTIFNVVGLALATWGVLVLMGTHTPFGPVAAITMTSGGLGLVMLSTVLLVASVAAALNWRIRSNKASQLEDEPPYPAYLPQRDQLVAVMENVHYAALELIERRREIHHLNTHQWHYAHREETAREIAAAKQYRQAKSSLELHRLSLPTQFWAPVDNYCEAIEQTMAQEVYSPPNDRQVGETFNRLWHSAMRQINDLAFAMTEPQEVRQAAD
jgi:hypothetical protein